jgi:hypothetical protein
MGTIGARFLASSKCEGAVTAITNCNVYNPNLASAGTTISGACMFCDATYTLVETTDATPTTTPTCVATIPTGCTASANCAQVLCSIDAAPATTPTCVLCNKDIASAGANSCTGVGVTGCAQARWNVAGSVSHCYHPSTGYAIMADFVTLQTYTTDPNCQFLVSATQCGTCKDGYYWDTTVCTLSAKLLGAAFLAVVALFIN